jgi:putative hydrolase of the HAD superfamily
LAIKAVLFDLGNTLVKYDYGLPEEVFQRVLSSLGIAKALDDIKKAFRSAEQEAEENKLFSFAGKIACEDFWYQWDALVLKHLQVGETEALPRRVHSEWMEHVDCTLYPEVREVLSELNDRGLKRGLISNAYEEEIDLILEKADLEKGIFDIIVGVDTIGQIKPSPSIFKYAITKLAVNSDETIFVGDNLEADYYGAESAGLHALLVDRTDKQHRDLKTIQNLTEILAQVS